MRVRPSLLAALSAVFSLQRGAAAGGSRPLSNSDSVVPGLFIVEFQPAQQLPLQHRDLDLIDAFHAHLKRDVIGDLVGQLGQVLQGVQYTTRYEYRDQSLFHGLSVSLANPQDVARLHTAPGVKAVYPVRKHFVSASLPNVHFDHVNVDHDNALDLAPQLARRANMSAPAANDTFSPHVMSRVDKLHAQGYTGKGMVVTILDTGVDYTHPALNGGKPAGTPCFAEPGCQIVGGTDLVGDHFTGANTPTPDSDPFSDCPGSGHGTHTSGIVVARDTTRGFTGVLPDGGVKMVRVFGCRGFTTDDVLIQALTWASNDGTDVISISIGDTGGFAGNPVAMVSDRISKKGTPVVWSFANIGNYGAFAMNDEGLSPSTTAVASIDNVLLPAFSVQIVGSTAGARNLSLLISNPWTFNSSGPTTLPLVLVNADPNSSNQACDPLPDNADFTGKVVLAARADTFSTCYDSEQFGNINDRGGEYVILWNRPPPAGIFYADQYASNQQVAAITYEDGQFLKSLLSSNGKIALDFSHQEPTLVKDTSRGGMASDFSSVGPSWDNDIHPSLAAPGGNILSTWPVKQGSYIVIGGTSMSTPFVAGSMALYKSIKGKQAKNTDELRELFIATATPVPNKMASSSLETVVKQGGGLVDVYRAVFSTTSVSPVKIALNDSAHFAAGPHSIQVSNTGTQSQTYEVTHLPAVTLASMNKTSNTFAYFPIPVLPAAAAVSFSSSSFTVGPGQSQTFTATIQPPSGLDPQQIPIYSGYIRITAKEDPDLGSVQVPYMGIAADMGSENTLETTHGLPVLVDPLGDPVHDDGHVFTLGLVNGTLDAPGLNWTSRLGSPYLSIDLVSANTTFNPTIPIHDQPSLISRQTALLDRRDSQPATTLHTRGPADTYAGVPTVGNVYNYTNWPRNIDWVETTDLKRQIISPNGTVANVTDGQYRLLLRALRLFGDATSEDAYDSYLSRPFTIKTAAQ